jgi:hypothetical protein
MSGYYFHVQHPRKKHEENSNQGDREAYRKDYPGNDHDQQKGKSGKKYNTHWKDVFGRDGFVDPKHEYGPHTPHPNAKFDDLPDEVILRLEAHHNGNVYRIRPTEQAIRYAAQVGLERLRIELKPGNDWTVQDCREIKAAAKQAGIRIVIATLDNWSGARRTLRRARLAGCRTQLLRA